MTRIDKFALCKAMFDSAPPEGCMPMAQHQWTMDLNAIATVVCRGYDEGLTFRALANRDNWIAQDNPFKDD